jgi:hypothetical protein
LASTAFGRNDDVKQAIEAKRIDMQNKAKQYHREQELKRKNLARLVAQENRKMAHERHQHEMAQSLQQIDLFISTVVSSGGT